MRDIKSLPNKPGCYLFKNKIGKVIYVGKAKNIKKRVSTYFNKNHSDKKTIQLVNNIDSVSFVMTDNEVEALILENNLIKRYFPKYNVLLKDNKRYAYLRITNEEFPRLVIARNKEEKGKYYGPFVSGTSRDYIRELLIKTFQLRTCKKLPKKVCLRYHIKLCKGPCEGMETRKEYQEKIKHVEMVLKGHTKELSELLNKKMIEHSKKQEFEKAIEYRNQLNAITWLSEKQKVQRTKKYDEDIINYFEKNEKIYLILFNVYKGILENKQEFEFEKTPNFFEEFIIRYYDDNPVPKEVIVPQKVDDSIEKFLTKKKGSTVRVVVPKVGEKKRLLELVMKNIDVTFFGEENKLEDLQKKLKLNDLPRVIECFDISHLSGTNTVASMVQFRNGKPDKNNYRRFKIRTVEGNDDFLSMAEVVRRRYTRLINEGKEMPNLIVIDGGKGQLSAALSELKKLGIKIPIISLAKKFEEIYLPGRQTPIRLSKKTEALKLLIAIRDEAHRFAISYNRLLRSKKLQRFKE